MKKQTTHHLWIIGQIMLIWVFASYSHAVAANTAAETASQNNLNALTALPVGKLNDIVDSIQSQKKEIEERLGMLKKTKSEQEKNKIQSEIDEISRTIEDQKTSFELILTAGQELASEEPEEEKQFDWQKDLLEIVQPILSELRQMTENRRKLDNLKKKITRYQTKTQEIVEVLNHFAKFDKAALEPDTLIEFAKIEKKWRSELQESNHLLEVAQLQFNEKIKSQTAREVSLTEHIEHFIVGRGTTLMMMIVTFVAVLFSLQLLWKAVVWIGFQKSTHWSYYQRLISLVYHSLTVMLAIAAAFYVLSVRDDQILLAIAVLLLISIIWVLKNSIPRYIEELKLLMNTGAVREGECINYNGIPMKIDRLSVYTKLTNPALPDLELRLPVSELSSYVSRPYLENEPWFPCQEGDYVILSDDRYGWVKCITLEHVQLSLSDGSMPQTYTISDFMCASPKNLSQGFLITSVIGIDYKHQSQCTTSIPGILEDGIRQRLLQESYGHALKKLSVYFELANTSSLDFKIIATFDGGAAGDYNAIKRDLQRFAVDVCTRQQWAIPFSQLVVHQGEQIFKNWA
ncbi:MAG: hypothetical protein H6937_03315 [Burkholderiales bacterium]|nr:hypothetical protein [Burkholderiales bacterium]